MTTSADSVLEQPVPRRQRNRKAALRAYREGGLREVARKAASRVRMIAQVKRYDYNLRRLYLRLERIPIDRPIFLLGVQGGGGTLIARTLYRHPRAVYATGNSTFWAGLDEVHNCRHTTTDLPEELIHRSAHFRNLDGRLECHPVYGHQRCWLYAIDELLPTYRRTASHANADSGARLRRVIRKIVRAYAHDPLAARFVDMSQLYTIQLSYIAELLKGAEPRFILVSRDPYSTCQRAVAKEYEGRGTRRTLDRSERIRCAVEHWDNSFRCALEDGEPLGMLHVRYEDFLDDPAAVVRRMCDFAGLDFDPRQVPGPGQRIPLGSHSPEKWYPLRPGENRRYRDALDRELVRVLNERSADLIRRLGYEEQGT